MLKEDDFSRPDGLWTPPEFQLRQEVNTIASEMINTRVDALENYVNNEILQLSRSLTKLEELEKKVLDILKSFEETIQKYEDIFNERETFAERVKAYDDRARLLEYRLEDVEAIAWRESV